MSDINFRVYGTEFCRMLAAVGLFQARPKEFESGAAVRCLASGEELVMAATNGVSTAIGSVQADDVDGRGPFSLPAAQVKAILAVFKRPIPKDHSSVDYVLEVTVTDEAIRIEDVSVLFDGDTFTIAVPHPDTAERGEPSESELVMRTLAMLANGLDPEQDDVTLTDGMHFSPVEVGLIARAAKGLGVELHARQLGRRLIAPLGEDFTAFTAGSMHAWDRIKPPYIDERAMRCWRSWLRDTVDNGVI